MNTRHSRVCEILLSFNLASLFACGIFSPRASQPSSTEEHREVLRTPASESLYVSQSIQPKRSDCLSDDYFQQLPSHQEIAQRHAYNAKSKISVPGGVIRCDDDTNSERDHSHWNACTGSFGMENLPRHCYVFLRGIDIAPLRQVQQAELRLWISSPHGGGLMDFVRMYVDEDQVVGQLFQWKFPAQPEAELWQIAKERQILSTCSRKIEYLWLSICDSTPIDQPAWKSIYAKMMKLLAIPPPGRHGGVVRFDRSRTIIFENMDDSGDYTAEVYSAEGSPVEAKTNAEILHILSQHLEIAFAGPAW